MLTAGDAPITMWVLGLTLVVLAGLNAPLAGLALNLAVASLQIVVHDELGWLVNPTMLWVWSGLVMLQFLADLFFVPATVRDRAYINHHRYVNAHLHARFQSLIRPFVGALAFAALPLSFQPQSAAVFGFVLGTGMYWTTAWMREHVAINRGSLILLFLEVTKNAIGLFVAALVAFLPALAWILLAMWLVPLVSWTARLQREQAAYPRLRGQIAQDD